MIGPKTITYSLLGLQLRGRCRDFVTNKGLFITTFVTNKGLFITK